MATLVTGGAGFLGSHLVDAILDRGEHVCVIDNLSTGRLRNLESAISSGRATFIFGDVVRSTAELSELIERSGIKILERIYHLASPASPTAYGKHPWETLAVNGNATMSLIDLALQHSAAFTFASTSEIYGDPEVHPQPETYFGNVDPIGPRCSYDEGKRFGEAAVAVAVRDRGLKGTIARFFNCYGPRMSDHDGRLFPALLDAIHESTPFPIHGTGQQTRSMTFIGDAVRGLMHVAENDSAVLRPMNVGNDEELSVEAIARIVAEVANVQFVAEYLEPRPQDPQRRRPDLTFARSTGWAPQTRFEDGVRATLEWDRKERLAYT